jgi:hypothetical protein
MAHGSSSLYHVQGAGQSQSPTAHYLPLPKTSRNIQPVFTDDFASSNYPVFKGPDDLVMTEDDAGRHCFRADVLE